MKVSSILCYAVYILEFLQLRVLAYIFVTDVDICMLTFIKMSAQLFPNRSSDIWDFFHFLFTTAYIHHQSNDIFL